MPMFDPNAPLPSFDAQTEAASRQRKMAELLRKRADSAATPDGKLISGIYVAPSITQYLGPLFEKLQAGYVGTKADKAEDDLSVVLGAEANKWRSGMPTPTPAVPREEDIMGNTVVQGEDAKPLDRQTVLKYTLAGMRNPKTREEAALVNKVMNEDINRGEDRQFKAEQARIAAQEKLELKREQFEAADRQLAEKLADKNLDREARAQLEKVRLEMMDQWKKADLAARRDIANLVASTKAAFAPKPPKPLPSAQSKSWIENNTAIKNAERALDLVEKNPSAFGIARGLPNALGATVGGAINQRLDPKGVDARAIVADIGSLKIHERSGAAVTAAEFPRLVPFIPLVSDKPETIKTKLRNFIRVYKDIQQEIKDYAENQNYIVPGKVTGDKDESPEKPQESETRVINGKTYIKRGNDWYEQ